MHPDSVLNTVSPNPPPNPLSPERPVSQLMSATELELAVLSRLSFQALVFYLLVNECGWASRSSGDLPT